SSRRRHTRSKRDWSSDVCSSDLTIHIVLRHLLENVLPEPFEVVLPMSVVHCIAVSIVVVNAHAQNVLSKVFALLLTQIIVYQSRSEERRVGKECSFRWLGDACSE